MARDRPRIMDTGMLLSGEWSDAQLMAAARARGVELGAEALPGLRANLALLRERSLTLLAVKARTEAP